MRQTDTAVGRHPDAASVGTTVNHRIAHAAKQLDMPLRTFVYKLKTLGIKRKSGGYHVVDDD